jgi:hypothetical protein
VVFGLQLASDLPHEFLRGICGVGVLEVAKKMKIECNRSLEEIMFIYSLSLFITGIVH